MCGRFTQTKTAVERIRALADIDLPPLFRGRYNVAPTQTVATIRAEAPTAVHPSVWGFTAPAGPVINARLETLGEKPLFRGLLERNRCLIPADGFYEWKGKQPWYFQLPDRSLFAFAGLWRPRHTAPDESECVIITRAAGPAVEPIHSRMPVILPPESWPLWLGGFRLPEPPSLEGRPVSPRVNRVINDDPSCIEPPEQGELFL